MATLRTLIPRFRRPVIRSFFRSFIYPGGRAVGVANPGGGSLPDHDPEMPVRRRFRHPTSSASMWRRFQNGGRDTMGSGSSDAASSGSQQIDAHIAGLDDWRGETLARVRALIRDAAPNVTEEWKWQKASSPGVPVWYCHGPICTGETYKSVVKLTFFKGASLEDPSGLFNSSLEGRTRRALDIREHDALDEAAFRALVREAVSLNRSARP